MKNAQQAVIVISDRFRVGAFALFLLVSGMMALASPVFAQNFTFSNVSVEGNQRIETGTILTYLGFGQGETVTAGAVNDAAQRIRGTGLFESVDVVPQGNTLVIRVVEFPTVNRITFEGNSRVRDAELSAVVTSQARRVYSPSQAEADTAAITQVYADQGRVNATVAPRIIERSDNRVDLVFEVFEGGLTEVERISFVGNRSFGENRLRRVLETKQAGILRAVIGRDTYIADRVAFDQQVLSDFYLSRGYVDFQVQNVDVSLTRERDAYLITFNVQEGQKFEFGNVTLTSEIVGADPEFYERALRLRTGVTYSPELIERDISRIELLALNEGLNFVRVEPRITRNDRTLTLDVEFAMVNGPRIFVERIDIEGNNTTLDRVVRSRFDVVEGDPFNPRQIRESAERIRALGYFSTAAVDAREGSSSDQVVIDVDVEEAPTGSLSFGGNFSTDSGFSLLAKFNQRNFLGRGQTLSFALQAGEDDQTLSFGFTEPRLLGRDLLFGLNASYNTSDSDDTTFDTTTARFQPRIGFPVSENGRLSLYYSYEYTDIKNVDTDASAYIVDDEGSVGTHALGYAYNYDTRRTGLNPNAGLLFEFGQKFGVGDASFIETTAEITGQTRVLNEELTLRATLEGGLLSYSDGNSRITDRYFLGSSIMRGFEVGGIGPRDTATDDALGGNAYAVLRLEAEFPLGLPEEYGISGGVFLDYGSVWDTGISGAGSGIEYDDFTPRTIAGVSIFWDTPIGPLRFNWTEPLDVQPNDVTKQFDVTISTEF
ncbi:outer membrane protein assembly factor BamA [Octadecabacter sp. 1_MG-2023]|uniref:outer membrane protein assembly factor BamA n=1 Tax=unclassified Octadecabacter TaxID=196158 RepID=UPI001C0A3635|nr:MULTISPECIES: outer membrane protein assembly factor BamA [unclassified Octadecabacter]MBU2993210.1 outer membrane protein assembly factor BamA [Octadecabacter sp. B2R22]MDO6733336.1 outer membrane protein assembly factor BamA [Octadecabacter sp. 1_MG-2023]